MITKNFRLNALANQYAAALYNHISNVNHGDYFMMDVGGESIRVAITGDIQGIRQLVDSYFLEALKADHLQWEDLGCSILNQCLLGNSLTAHGLSMWESMIADMSASLAAHGGGLDA